MADDKKKTTSTDNVEVKSDKSVDPQLILVLKTKDDTPFNAIVEVDLTVRNVHDRRVFGHAKTMDYVRDTEVTIPINFSDSIKDWKRACAIPGAQLGYGVAVHLFYENGTEEIVHLYDYMTPTFDPPITVDGVWNQYENDLQENDPNTGSHIEPGTLLEKGDKFHGPNGLFYLAFQHDGNLVVNYIEGDHFSWGTHNHIGVPLDGSYAKLHTDGNLHVYDEYHELMWQTESEGGAVLSISGHGTPIILNEYGDLIWEG